MTSFNFSKFFADGALSSGNEVMFIVIALAIIDFFTQIFSKNTSTVLSEKQKKNFFSTGTFLNKKVIGNRNFIFTLLGFLMIGLLNIKLNTIHNMSTAYTLHVLSHIVVIGGLSIVGGLFYGEHISLMQIIGIAFVVMSIVILGFGGHGHEHGHGHGHTH